jgi:hypothetical protein
MPSIPIVLFVRRGDLRNSDGRSAGDAGWDATATAPTENLDRPRIRAIAATRNWRHGFS